MATTTRQANMGATPARYTVRDLEALPDDGFHRELIDGEIFVTPPPYVWHQEVSRLLFLALSRAAEAGDRGRIYCAPTGLRFSDHDMVEPDLFLVPADRVPELFGNYVLSIPPLIVEILSPSNRAHDVIRKRRTYERFQVPEYWVVDKEIEAITVYRLEAGRYARGVEYAAARGDRLTTPALPGLEIELACLFRDLPPHLRPDGTVDPVLPRWPFGRKAAAKRRRAPAKPKKRR